MNPVRDFWRQWAETLRRYRLHHITAAFLEAAAPLTAIGAQMIYFSSGLFSNQQLNSLARLLEDDVETRRFAEYLKGSLGP